MNNLMKIYFTFALLASAAVAAPLHAQVENHLFTINAIIPDNDSGGLASFRSLTSSITSITDVQLTLNITGGYNGDYYAYLTHDSGFTILLNRVGATLGNPYGTVDAGFTNVTFSGSAINDIHNYQSVSNPAGGALSGGIWAPDGRDVDPAFTVDTDPRSAFLSSFNGLDANGGWTLFIADLAPAGQGTLVSWDLQITGVVSAVPEPGTWLAGTLAVASFAVWRRRRMK